VAPFPIPGNNFNQSEFFAEHSRFVHSSGLSAINSKYLEPVIACSQLLAEGVKMTRRGRIAISAGFMTMSVTAVAAAASRTGAEVGASPAGLLTLALAGIVLTFLVWSDELDRSSVKRSRAAQRRDR
jgi:hypothetical protein